MAILTIEGAVEVWDVAAGRLATSVAAEPAERPLWYAMPGLAFSHDGRLLAVGGWNGTARLWDLSDGQVKATFRAGHTSVQGLVFSPNGKTLAIASYDPTTAETWRTSELTLWDVENQKPIALVPDRRVEPEAFAFSPDGHTLAAGSWDRRARLWDAKTGRLKATLQGHTTRRGVYNLAPGDDEKAAVLEGHPGPVTAVSFAPDGTTVATGSFGEARLWDAASGELRAALKGLDGFADPAAYSRDGKILATRDQTSRVRLWDAATGKEIPFTSLSQASSFAEVVMHPTSVAGAAVSLHDPRDGRIVATALPMPGAAPGMGSAVAVAGGSATSVTLARNGEWFVATPEGYFDGSVNAARFIKWNVNGRLYPAERYLRRFRRPDLVQKALRGERITAPVITMNDTPPEVRFIGFKTGEAIRGGSLSVSLEVRDDGNSGDVEMFVNGRPLPPEHARPIERLSRPIERLSRSIDSTYRTARRVMFRVPLPEGSPDVRLRAVAYGATNLGSDPVEIVLKHGAKKPVTGNLFVLSVGVSRYKLAGRKGVTNLRFPVADAKAVADRFRGEGQPLYGKVDVRTVLNEQATVTNIRSELRRLQQVVRRGQVDTVVLFLSGHGISAGGRYHFGTYEVDPDRVAATSISGQELRDALGGKLRARSVFLFVDTCHSGGMGGRSDDLALEVGEGVYFLASSSASEYSYEDPAWGHGAFTLGLLRTLNNKALASDGQVRFAGLCFGVSEEVASLMKAAGFGESEQEPCVPLAARRLRVPVASVRP